MIRKLDWYLFRKFVFTFFFMVFLLIVIVVVIDFSEKLDDFVKNDVPTSDVIFWYYANFVPWLGNLLSPICVFLAAIFVTAKLTQDSEIIAMLSGGINFYRLLMPYLVGALLFSALSFYLNAFLVPKAMDSRMDFEYKYFEKRSEYEARNIHKKIAPGLYAYMYRYDQYDMEAKLFSIEKFDSTGFLTTKLTAPNARYNDSTGVWSLNRVLIRHFRPDGTYRLERVAKLDTAIMLRHEDIYQRKNFAQSLTLPQLNEFIALERERGSDYLQELELEKHTRTAVPFSSFIMTIIAFALSTKKRRGGIALQLGLGFIICFVYVFFLVVSKGALGGLMPPWLAIWLPNLTFFFFGLVLLRLAPK